MRKRTVFIILIPIILLAAALVLGSVLLLRLFIASVLLLLVSYLWTLFSLRKISIKCTTPPEHIQANSSFQWQAVVNNFDNLPQPSVLLQINTDLPGQRNTVAAGIPAKDSYTWTTDITCLHRGSYHLGTVRITATDPFGLFTRSRVLGNADEFIVYPPTIDLPHFKFSSLGDPGSGPRSFNRISINAAGIRDYDSGDSLRHIHWPSTARTGKIMVKLFDTDRSYDTSKIGWVLLDIHTASHLLTATIPSDEHAITIAASFIKKYVQAGMRVGMLTSGNDIIKPDRGEEHQWSLLKILALLPANNRASLQETLGNNTGNFKDHPLIVLIVTSLTKGITETIQKLKNWSDSIAVVYLDLTSWQEQHTGKYRRPDLQRLGVQVFSIRKTDDLPAALDSKAVAAQR